MGGQLLSAAWTAGITIVVVFVGIVGIGFWMLARRKKTGREPDAWGSLQQRANILLVRVDDAVKNAEDELGFAIAQFGDVKSQEFESVLTTSRTQLREAFSLQQKLDDSFADSDTQKRDWSGRIIHLCETAQASLDEQEKSFAGLRELEKNAPQNLAAVRSAISTVDNRLRSGAEIFATLAHRYDPSAISTVADNVARARTEHADAIDDADRAEKLIAEPSSGGASKAETSASDLIRSAGEHAYRAQKLLDAIEELRGELTKTCDAVTALRESTRTNLARARAVRDAPPDADAGANLGGAIQKIEAALAADTDLRKPLETLELLRVANAELDSSMASARNQTQRLEGARTALVGALVGARSQVSVTRNFINTRRGGVGTDARTRLAEAERLLVVAEAEADPVAALDTARSSATYSRDADALARFDLLGR